MTGALILLAVWLAVGVIALAATFGGSAALLGRDQPALPAMRAAMISAPVSHCSGAPVPFDFFTQSLPPSMPSYPLGSLRFGSPASAYPVH